MCCFRAPPDYRVLWSAEQSPTCSPFNKRQVVEIGVPGQSCLYYVLSEMQLLEQDQSELRLLQSLCPDGGGVGTGAEGCHGHRGRSSTYHVIFVCNYHPLHQARNHLGREEGLAITGNRHDAMF